MSQKRFLRVVNFDDQLHYKDRNPIWIKLSCAILDDYDFCALSDGTKFQAVGLMILAARLNNKLPDDEAWLRQKINASSKINLKLLLEVGFLEVIKSTRNKNKSDLSKVKSDIRDDLADAKDSFNDCKPNKLNGDCASATFAEAKNCASTEQNRTDEMRTDENTTEQTRELPSAFDAKNVAVCDFSKSSEIKAGEIYQTARAAADRPQSRFTLEECLRYAEQAENVKNPRGLANSLYRSGNADAFIMAMLYPIEAAAANAQQDAQRYGSPVGFTNEPCRVCFGAKMADADGRGFRHCSHCRNERGKATGLEPAEVENVDEKK